MVQEPILETFFPSDKDFPLEQKFEERENQQVLPLDSAQQEGGDILTTLVVHDDVQEVCKSPIPIKIENDDDGALFWDDLETFILELDTLVMSSNELGQIGEVVEGPVGNTFDLENVMLQNSIVYNDESTRRLMDLSNSDQHHEVLPSLLVSNEVIIPSLHEVMVDQVIDKAEKLEFSLTRGCPIRYFSMMDIKEEVSILEEKLSFLCAPCSGNVNFDQNQKVCELSFYFHIML